MSYSKQTCGVRKVVFLVHVDFFCCVRSIACYSYILHVLDAVGHVLFVLIGSSELLVPSKKDFGEVLDVACFETSRRASGRGGFGVSSVSVGVGVYKGFSCWVIFL